MTTWEPVVDEGNDGIRVDRLLMAQTPGDRVEKGRPLNVISMVSGRRRKEVPELGTPAVPTA